MSERLAANPGAQAVEAPSDKQVKFLKGLRASCKVDFHPAALLSKTVASSEIDRLRSLKRE